MAGHGRDSETSLSLSPVRVLSVLVKLPDDGMRVTCGKENTHTHTHIHNTSAWAIEAGWQCAEKYHRKDCID